MTLKWRNYIEGRKDVMMRTPIFKDMQLTVEHILSELGTGMTHAELLDNYPNLRPEHIRAACLFAAAVVSMDESYV